MSTTRSRSRQYDRGGRSDRGFASMDREKQRRIAGEGGRVSRGERGRDYDEYEEDYDRDYDDYSGRYEEDYDDYEGSYDEYDEYESDYDQDYDDRGGRRSGGRGFSSMDEEKQRRMASMGGRSSHSGGRRGEYEDQSYSRDYDSDYDERGGSRSGGRRFASMDPEGQRRIAPTAGRASNRGGRSSRSGERSSRGRDRDRDDRSRRSSSRGRSESGTSRRGFASMDPEKQRRIASMGGRAAHRYGSAHEFTPEEARRAGRKGGRARWSN